MKPMAKVTFSIGHCILICTSLFNLKEDYDIY